jgi:hypothetical protein
VTWIAVPVLLVIALWAIYMLIMGWREGRKIVEDTRRYLITRWFDPRQ